jgi:hypothetical protein
MLPQVEKREIAMTVIALTGKLVVSGADVVAGVA